jgi:hypothetical protein
LSSDERLFEKLKFMQENVVGSAHLIHNSMGELTRAINAAHTTLYNSINAFNALNFNKFLENVKIISQLIVNRLWKTSMIVISLSKMNKNHQKICLAILKLRMKSWLLL